jgi:hypothetical protein
VARRARGRRKLRICAINSYWSWTAAAAATARTTSTIPARPTLHAHHARPHTLYGARDIRPGEEITLDYVTTLHSNDKRCRCKAPTCRGTINKQ